MRVFPLSDIDLYLFGSVGRLGIVDQHPHRRGFQVVVLATPNTSYACDQGSSAQRNSNRQGNVQDTHVRDSTSKLLNPKVTASTLTELMGINMAAANGLIQPNMASTTDIKLYDNEIAKLR